MNNFLKSIIEYKKTEIKEIENKFKQGKYSDNPFAFKKLFEKQGFKIIAEFKKSSPSEGNINKSADLKKYIATYNTFADAISILTEKKYFSGDIEYIKEARKYTKLPILAKDFYLHPSQIYMASVYGVNAVLIIVRILEKDMIKKLYETAKELGLDSIVEVHSTEEVEKALDAIKPDIMGINSRNLEDFSINFNTFDEVREVIPEGIKVIAESGIKKSSDIENLKHKFDGVLIGTSLMKNSLELKV